MPQQPSSALAPGDLVAGRSFTFGQVGGAVHATLTLERRGHIRGSRHPNETAWRVDRGDVLFLDDVGRVTTRFHELAVLNGLIVLLGEFLETGTVHFLSAPTSERDAAPRSPHDAGHEPPDVGSLTAPVWGLGRLGGGVVTDLFILRDGRLQGAGSPNEARWALGDDGSLLFFGVDGEITTTFTTRVRTTRGDVWLGPFVDGRTIHFLSPSVDPGHPDWLPPFAASLMAQQREVSEPWGPLRPHLLAPDRYLAARRHLFSLATGEVLDPGRGRSTLPADGDGDGRHGDGHRTVDDVDGRIDEIRRVFDDVVAEFALDPRALFWFSIKGSDAVALYDHVLANRPRRCLQIGTFAGFSALLIADALRAAGGGRVTAIDPEIPHENVMTPVDVAREVAVRLGLEDHCRFERGWGSTMIGLPPYEHWKHTVPLVGQALLSEMGGGVDLVFIDADHSVTATIADFMLVKDFMAEGGTVFFHDVFNWPSVTEAVEVILNDIHYDRGTHQLWQFDVNCGPDGLAALRRRPTPPSPALTVTVVDAATGRPVPAADVTAIGFDTAATSSRGEVVFFRELPEGTSVEVRAPGRRPERKRLDRATDGRAVTLTVALAPAGDGPTGAPPSR